MSGLFDLCSETTINATLLTHLLRQKVLVVCTLKEPLDLESIKANKEVSNWSTGDRTERHDQALQSLSDTSTTEDRSSKNGRETGKENPGSEVKGR